MPVTTSPNNARASSRATARDDRRDELVAVLALTIHELATRPEGIVEKLERLGNEALELFEGSDDDAGLTRAWLALAYAAHVRGRYAVRNDAFEHALFHAVRCDDSSPPVPAGRNRCSSSCRWLCWFRFWRWRCLAAW